MLIPKHYFTAFIFKHNYDEQQNIPATKLPPCCRDGLTLVLQLFAKELIEAASRHHLL